MELRLKVDDKYMSTFLAMIEKLHYVEIKEIVPNTVQEPSAPYKKRPKRPSADEIEAMIIKKALKDAQAIERGELKLKSYNNYKDLIADLEADLEDDDIHTNQ